MIFPRNFAPTASSLLKLQEGVYSASHPEAHQCNNISKQWGGCPEPTSPILACTPNLPINKDDSLVTAAAAEWNKIRKITHSRSTFLPFIFILITN